MNSSLQAFDIAKGFRQNFFTGNDVFIAVPFPYIQTARSMFPEYIKVGAQDCSQFEGGPYTGEVSAAMVKEMGAEYVIVGHSERRRWLGESAEVISKKVGNAARQGLNVVVCVGEGPEDRDGGRHLEVVRDQLTPLEKEMCGRDNVDIAYEPVWAIGTGRTPTNEQIREVISSIKRWGRGVGFCGRVVYGGSVSMLNCQTILSVEEIDGFLIGATSLKMDFCMISSEMGARQ